MNDTVARASVDHSAFIEIERDCGERFKELLDTQQHPFVQDYFERWIQPALRARAFANRADHTEYCEWLTNAQAIMCELHEALHQYGAYDVAKPRATYVWRHKTPDPLRADDKSRGFAIDRSSLVALAARYVSQPNVQTDAMDWLFMDSLVFAELDAFSEQVMSGTLFGTVNFAYILAERNAAKFYAYSLVFSILFFAVRYLALPALAFYLAAKGHDGWAGMIFVAWIVYVLLRFIGFLPRRRARNKALELMTLMNDAYGNLGSSVISPTRLRDSLWKAADAGVVWDGAVFALADRVIARDSTAFVPCPSR